MIVWDCSAPPTDSMGEVLCWQSYAEDGQVFSIPQYLEQHAERIRKKYLAFIHDLGESRINGKRVVEHLDTGDGFSYWWMSLLAGKSPLKSERIYSCLRLLALEEILLERMPTELILHGSDRRLAQALERLCLNLQVPFVWELGEASKQKWSLRRLFMCLPYTMQGLISLVRHLVMRWPLRKLQKPQWFSGENAIFLCSYFIHLDPVSCAEGRFYSRQWGSLTKYLHDSGRRTNWLQHFLFSQVIPDVRMGLGWLRLFNRDTNRNGCHSFLDTYLTWGVVGRVLKCWFLLQIASWRLRHIQSAFYPNGSAVWLWPILQDDWLVSLKGHVAMTNCQWMVLFDSALSDMPKHKIGLYLCENQGWERALLHAWRKHGHGKIIGVPHSTVPFWHLNYFNDPRGLYSQQSFAMPLPDGMAINGPIARKMFVEAGYPNGQLVEVEALRYLNLLGMNAKCNMDSTKCSMPSIKVLILGEIIPTSMHSFLVLVEDAMKLLPSYYSFTFKPHPGCAVNLEDYPGLQADETTEALDRVLGEYDVALSTNSTSASVDAYVMGLPVIIGLDGASLNLSPLRGQSGVSFVSTPEELAEALEAAREGTMNYGHNDFFFLDNELPRWQRLLELQ